MRKKMIGLVIAMGLILMAGNAFAGLFPTETWKSLGQRLYEWWEYEDGAGVKYYSTYLENADLPIAGTDINDLAGAIPKVEVTEEVYQFLDAAGNPQDDYRINWYVHNTWYPGGDTTIDLFHVANNGWKDVAYIGPFDVDTWVGEVVCDEYQFHDGVSFCNEVNLYVELHDYPGGTSIVPATVGWDGGGAVNAGNPGYPDDGCWGWVTSGPIPEPSTLLLLGSGLFGLAFYARRKRKTS